LRLGRRSDRQTEGSQQGRFVGVFHISSFVESYCLLVWLCSKPLFFGRIYDH